MNSKLLISRIFLVISIIFGIIFLVFYFYFQDIKYLNLFRLIALMTFACNAISFIFKYMAYKIDGIEVKYW